MATSPLADGTAPRDGSGGRPDLIYRSIPRMALVNAQRFSRDLAILDGGRSVTFDDVAEGMLAVGQALLANGVAPGDRVAVWAPNSADWVTTALGILASG